MLVNSGGPPTGDFDELDDATWTRAIDGTLRSAIRLIRAGAAAPSGERSAGDPGDPVVIGPRADPGPDRVEHAASRTGRSHQVAHARDRPGPDQRPGARPGRDRPDRRRSRRRPPRGPGTTPRRSAPPRSPASRSVATATPPSSVGSARSCCRPPRRTSRAPSSRSTAAWSGACPDASRVPLGRPEPLAARTTCRAAGSCSGPSAGSCPARRWTSALDAAEPLEAAGIGDDVHQARREPDEPRRGGRGRRPLHRGARRDHGARLSTARCRSSRPSWASTSTRTGRSRISRGSPDSRRDRLVPLDRHGGQRLHRADDPAVRAPARGPAADGHLPPGLPQANRRRHRAAHAAGPGDPPGEGRVRRAGGDRLSRQAPGRCQLSRRSPVDSSRTVAGGRSGSVSGRTTSR